MKAALESKDIGTSRISKDLIVIKSIIATVKHANLNDQMPDGYLLIQEVPNRFGITFDVVQRFIKSASRLCQLV